MAEPTISSVAAAAAAAASKFSTTLLLLFFVAPPAHLKQESQRVWTLQSTSEIQTESPEMCVSIGKSIIDDIEPVNTLTVRAYCLCPAGNGSNLCFFREEHKEQVSLAMRKAAPMPLPTVQRLGPRTRLPPLPSPPPLPADGPAKE